MKDENELVAHIRQRLWRAIPAAQRRRLPQGTADDAAVLTVPGNRRCVVSCDACLEGVHFRTDLHPAQAIGYRALVRAASDLAAMGAEPGFFLLSLELPRTRLGAWLNELLAGLGQAIRQTGLLPAGGDTTTGSRVGLVVTVIGFAPARQPVFRHTARPGDRLFVSGRLGLSRLGWEYLRRGLAQRSEARRAVRAHLWPPVRLALGQWLARRRLVSAMMDLSDGLSTDLDRMVRASGVGARIMLEHLPVPARTPLLDRLGLDPVELALHGGEDYELLFTVPPRHIHRLPRRLHGVALHEIGEVTAGNAIELVRANRPAGRLEPRGWDPFRRR